MKTKNYLIILLTIFFGLFTQFKGQAQTFTTIATDAANDGSNPSLLDGTLLEYSYDQLTDTLTFRVTVTNLSTNLSAIGVNFMVNIPGGGPTFNFWGTPNNAAYHRLGTTWVTGTAPNFNYSGTIGIADNVGVAGNNFTNLSANNITFSIVSTNQIVLKLKRTDLIPDILFGASNTITCVTAAAVGSNQFWNDDIYSPTGAMTITKLPAPFTFGNISIGSPSCSPGGDATITATSTGGIGTITYRINSDSNTTGLFTNYGVGTYTLYIRDGVNNTADTTITILTPPALTWNSNSSTSTNETCNGNTDGTVSLAVNGGTPPITYSLNPSIGSNTTGNFNSLVPGAYTATATDSKNCAVNTALTLNVGAGSNISINVTNLQPTTGGMSNGVVTVAAVGSAGITYSISPNAGTQSPPGTFTGLAAGTYTISATDANNCIVTTACLVRSPTSVNDITKHNIKVYPNPVTDLLKLESDVEIIEVSVLDITGKTVRTINKSINSFSMYGLTEGIYILELTLKNEEVIHLRISKL